ncbi:unnamed protein product [marine sediment metagenome]|uniref:Uncharacterized protein n=1 Tax=marine sediment metagenome TaxID=412755 RepID=X0UMZ5_9ZZZZ
MAQRGMRREKPIALQVPLPVQQAWGDEVADAFIEWMETEVLPRAVPWDKDRLRRRRPRKTSGQRVPVPLPLPASVREVWGDEAADAFIEWMETEVLPHVVSWDE